MGDGHVEDAFSAATRQIGELAAEVTRLKELHSSARAQAESFLQEKERLKDAQKELDDLRMTVWAIHCNTVPNTFNSMCDKTGPAHEGEVHDVAEHYAAHLRMVDQACIAGLKGWRP